MCGRTVMIVVGLFRCSSHFRCMHSHVDHKSSPLLLGFPFRSVLGCVFVFGGRGLIDGFDAFPGGFPST